MLSTPRKDGKRDGGPAARGRQRSQESEEDCLNDDAKREEMCQAMIARMKKVYIDDIVETDLVFFHARVLPTSSRPPFGLCPLTRITFRMYFGSLVVFFPFSNPA